MGKLYSCTHWSVNSAEAHLCRPFNEYIRRALPIARVGSFARAKQSIVRAFLSTWMYIFQKVGASDKLSA